MRPVAFAIPGDIATLTGGYIYEHRLLMGLRAQGRDVRHIELGDSFPDPTEAHMADAVTKLTALEPERALILDGLVYGSIDTAGLARARAPIVAMIHHPLALETGLSETQRAHFFRTERDNLALAAKVLVPSPHTAAILSADYGVPPDRITIARPGTDRPRAAPDPATPPLILSVGIQHRRKGHDVLLKALARLGDLDWQAVIVGSSHDAAYAAELQRLYRALELGIRVRFAGRVERDALDGLYSAASIFALATRYEGYGIVFDEALAHGLPIVTCRTGAVPQTVPPNAGLLVSPDDPKGFAEALRSLLAQPDERRSLAQAARLAGQTLQGWSETAATAGRAIDRIAF